MSELYPGSKQIPAMLINKAANKDKLNAILASKDYLGQIKKDGYFYQLEKTDAGDIYLFSRSKSKKTGELTEKSANCPHLKNWAKDLPNGTILIGELYYPGKTSKDVTKIMGCLPAKAIERQEKEYGWIHYYIHDMIFYDGNDMREMPFEKRYSELCRHIDLGMPAHDWLEIATVFENYDYPNQMADIVGRLLADGEEGAVLKSKSGVYAEGKRPTYNIKIKQAANDIDVVITDILPPVKEYTGKEPDIWPYWIIEHQTKMCWQEIKRSNGKELPERVRSPEFRTILVTKAYYYGWGGALEISLSNGDGTWRIVGSVASGLTDEDKKDMGENPKNWLWQVAELSAMSVDKNAKSIRHPVFVRVRDDKTPEECTVESVFNK